MLQMYCIAFGCAPWSSEDLGRRKQTSPLLVRWGLVNQSAHSSGTETGHQSSASYTSVCIEGT